MQKENIFPPYLKGGTPGALIVFKFAEAILSIISCVALVVSLFASLSGGNFLVGLLTTSASAFGLVLSIIEGFAALKLRHGDYASAAKIRSVWSIRRVLLIIAMILIGIVSVISMFSRGGFLAGLISLILYGGILIVMLNYANDVRSNLEVVTSELFSGEPASYVPANRLSGIAIFLSVLMALGTLIMMFGVNVSSGLSYSLRSAFRSYGSILFLWLFLTAARFCLVAGCNRAFKRAHDPRDDMSVYAPARMASASTLSIIGAILFSWQALQQVSTIVTYFGYGYNAFARNIVFLCGYMLVFALFAVALLVARARDLLALIGAGLAVILVSMSFINLLGSGLRNTAFFYIGYYLLFGAGAAMLIVMAILSLAHRPVPFALRIVAIALFGAAFLLDLVGEIVNYSEYFLEYQLPSVFSSTVPEVIGLVAVALAVGRAPKPTDTPAPAEIPAADDADQLPPPQEPGIE